MTPTDDDPKAEDAQRGEPRGLAFSDSETPIFGRVTTQMLRSAAHEVITAYQLDAEYPDKHDYACMVEGLEQIEMCHSFILQRVPELREAVGEAAPLKIGTKVVGMLKRLLSHLHRYERAQAQYEPAFCAVCYCHRDARSGSYCQLHKPLAQDKKAYQSGKSRFDAFFDAVIDKHNAAVSAKQIPHGLDMVMPEGFNYPNIVRLLSAFPLANAVLLPVVHECKMSDEPLSYFEVLARIYDKALDPDGVELVRRLEAANNHSFRWLQDLMHFVTRYEACLALKEAAPPKRGPKVRHSPMSIRKYVAANPGKPMAQIARELKCSRTILYQAMKQPK